MEKYVALDSWGSADRRSFCAWIQGHWLTIVCLIGRNLMAPDDFKNLGLIFEKQESQGRDNAGIGSGENGESKS